MIQLTREQQQIIHHCEGHALVSAVAGSGKTTTMVGRVQRLLKQGCAASELLVLMFNRSARDDFAARLRSELAGSGISVPEVRTFHALGLRLVESFVRRNALPARRLVTDELIRERLAKQTLNSAYKDEEGQHCWVSKEDLEEFLRFIELVKSTTGSPLECFERAGLRENYGYFLEGFNRFEEARKHQRLRFFEDLLYEPLMAMLAEAELAAWVTGRVEHIIIDEYQDINEVQQRLLQILAGDRARVMAVGDVDQCIYEWRGARPDYITSRFALDFPAPVRYTLSHTFRYGHRLSLAANHLISRNRQRDHKLCISASGNFDTRIELHPEELRHPVLNILHRWRQEGRSLSEAAVLVRLFSLSVPIELALLEEGIPYTLEGHEQVFECREIMALTGYLKLCTSTLEREEWEVRVSYLTAMLSQPHLGLRQELIERLARDIAANVALAPRCILRQISDDLAPFIRKKIAQLAEDWQYLLDLSGMKRADVLLGEIVNRLELYDFYLKFSSRQAVAENRIETCRSFIDFAARHKLNAPEFLELLRELQLRKADQMGTGLLITSVHRAKGLEWPLVVIPGLKEGLFPFLAMTDEEARESVEDERRLFYVALTRGIERVSLIHPPDHLLKTRMELGMASFPSAEAKASRFLYEANIRMSDLVGATFYNSTKEAVSAIEPVDVQVSNDYLLQTKSSLQQFTARSKGRRKQPKKEHTLRTSDLANGLTVFHKSFGEGRIIEVLDRSLGRIRVQFHEHGEKTLLLSFAPLTVRL